MFFPALKKALSKARKKLVAHNQDLEEDPTAREDKDKAVRSLCMVWPFEDSIH